MSTRATLGLLGTFALLAGAYWFTGFLERRSEREAREARRVFHFSVDEITSLSVEQEGKAPIEAMRRPGGPWRIVAPHDRIPPNEQLWGRVAANVAELSNERTIDESPADLGPFGLDRPRLSVIVGTLEGELRQIQFGAVDATTEYRFARVGDGPVFLATKNAFFELNRSSLDLRDRNLIHPGEEGITRIEFSRFWQGKSEKADDGGPDAPELEVGEESVRVIVERGKDGRWVMLEPAPGRGNQERIEALAKEIQFALGREYVDEPGHPSDYGLQPPWGKVTVYGDESGGPRTLFLGAVAGPEQGNGIFVKLDHLPSVFVIDAHIMTLVPESPEAFRDPKLFSRRASDLRQIRYRDRRNRVTLTNDPETGWRLTEPPHDDIDYEAVSQYLSHLKDVFGTSFPREAGDFGLGDPRILLEFTFAPDGETTTIAVGGPVPDSSLELHYVRTDDGTVTTIPLGAMLALQVTPFTFRDKHIFSFDPGEAVGVEIELDGKGYELRRSEDRWVVDAPPGHRLGSQADAYDALRELAGTLAIDAADPPPSVDVQGVNTPVLVATVVVGGESGERRVGPLKIGALKATNARERFATVEGRPEVFFVDQTLVDNVRAALRGITPGN